MGISWNIETYDVLASTQREVIKRARSGAPEGLVVQAKSQTSGKGRYGRSWVSQEGNLFFSFLLRPECSALRVGFYSLMTAVAVGHTLQRFVRNRDDLMLKWPNDVLLGGRKCAGILLDAQPNSEQVIPWLCVGVGVNIAKAPKEGAHLDQDVAPEELCKKILENVENLYSRSFEEIKADWLAMSCTPGTSINVKTADKVHQGRFHGIDDHGALLLEEDSIIRTMTAGDVYLCS